MGVMFIGDVLRRCGLRKSESGSLGSGDVCVGTRSLEMIRSPADL